MFRQEWGNTSVWCLWPNKIQIRFTDLCQPKRTPFQKMQTVSYNLSQWYTFKSGITPLQKDNDKLHKASLESYQAKVLRVWEEWFRRQAFLLVCEDYCSVFCGVEENTLAFKVFVFQSKTSIMSAQVVSLVLKGLLLHCFWVMLLWDVFPYIEFPKHSSSAQ